jgi:hypothetical protein
LKVVDYHLRVIDRGRAAEEKVARAAMPRAAVGKSRRVHHDLSGAMDVNRYRALWRA